MASVALDDIDGTLADVTVRIELSDGTYELDLSHANEQALRERISKYLSHARHVAGPRAGGASAAEMRAWARQALADDHVPERGPLPDRIRAAYLAAHAQEGQPA